MISLSFRVFLMKSNHTTDPSITALIYDFNTTLEYLPNYVEICGKVLYNKVIRLQKNAS